MLRLGNTILRDGNDLVNDFFEVKVLALQLKIVVFNFDRFDDIWLNGKSLGKFSGVNWCLEFLNLLDDMAVYIEEQEGALIALRVSN